MAWLIFTALTVVAFGFCTYSLSEQDIESEKSIEEVIAEKLGAETSEIIVAEFNDGKSSAKSENGNLRSVYYGGKTYIAEIEDDEVVKLIEQ